MMQDLTAESKLPVVVEYDHGVLVNGISIPYVLCDGVKYDPASRTVTIRMLCRSFVKYSGQASRDFQERHHL